MSSSMGSVLSVVILFVFLYFVMIRPQRKQQKKLQDQRDSMRIGDEVLTAGGFYGVISAIDDENVVIELLPDFQKAMIRKQSIVKVLRPEDEEEEEHAGLFGHKKKKAEEANDVEAQEVTEVAEDEQSDADKAE